MDIEEGRGRLNAGAPITGGRGYESRNRTWVRRYGSRLHRGNKNAGSAILSNMRAGMGIGSAPA